MKPKAGEKKIEEKEKEKKMPSPNVYGCWSRVEGRTPVWRVPIWGRQGESRMGKNLRGMVCFEML